MSATTAAGPSAVARWVILGGCAALLAAAVALAGLQGVVMALLAVAIVAAALFQRPALAIMAIVFLIYVNASDVLTEAHGFNGLTELLVLGLAAIAVRDRFAGAPLPRALPAVLAIFAVFVIARAGSALSSRDPALSLAGAIETAEQCIVAALLVIVITDMRRLTAAILGIVAGAGLLASMTVVQSVFGLWWMDFGGFAGASVSYSADEVEKVRLGGPVAEPNYYAQILLLALPLAFTSMSLTTQPWLRAVLFATGLLVLAAILATFSRGGMVALVILAVVALWSRRWQMLFALALLVVVGAVGLQFLPETYSARLLATFTDAAALLSGEGYIQDLAISGRIAEMVAAYRLFEENPVFGAGYGTYESLYQDTARRYGLMARGAERQAHSLYLEILAEQGLAGALVFTGLLGYAFLSVRRGVATLTARGRPGEATAIHGLALALVAYLASSIFLHEAFAKYFWLIVAMCCCAPQAAGAWRMAAPFGRTGSAKRDVRA